MNSADIKREMRLRRERILLLGVAVVLIFSAVMTVRQIVEDQSRHSEIREAFILSHNTGRSPEAQGLYDRLICDLPEQRTRNLIDDLERTAVIAPINESGSSNLLVRYHLSVQHEVQKRVDQKSLKAEKTVNGS